MIVCFYQHSLLCVDFCTLLLFFFVLIYLETTMDMQNFLPQIVTQDQIFIGWR